MEQPEEQKAIAAGITAEAEDIARRSSGIVQRHCTTEGKLNSNLALIVLLIQAINLIDLSVIGETQVGKLLAQQLRGWQDQITAFEVTRILQERD